jgi:hypothetical protein
VIFIVILAILHILETVINSLLECPPHTLLSEKKRKEKKRDKKELGSSRTTRETEGLGTCHPQERGNRVSETSEIK